MRAAQSLVKNEENPLMDILEKNKKNQTANPSKEFLLPFGLLIYAVSAAINCSIAW